jgi:hypothetical protein
VLLKDLDHIFAFGFHHNKVASRCINLADCGGEIRFILQHGEHEAELIKEQRSVFKNADDHSFFTFLFLVLCCVPRLVKSVIGLNCAEFF